MNSSSLKVQSFAESTPEESTPENIRLSRTDYHGNRPSRTLTKEEEFVWEKQASVFNYYAGYYSNGSIVLLLLIISLGSKGPIPTVGEYIGYALAGLGVWTFMEYWFHRLPYHHGPQMVVMGHEMHHESPKALLGVPYYVTAMWYVPLYYGLSYIFNPAKLAIFMASFCVGYIGYCGVHHATHHWNFKNGLFKLWKSHHLVHHHHPDKNYSITCPFWDTVFGTRM